MNAKIDGNGTRTALGTLQSDGVTPIAIVINPINHGFKVINGTTGTNLASSTAKRDENSTPVLMGVSNVDGITPVPVATDSNGYILIQST